MFDVGCRAFKALRIEDAHAVLIDRVYMLQFAVTSLIKSCRPRDIVLRIFDALDKKEGVVVVGVPVIQNIDGVYLSG